VTARGVLLLVDDDEAMRLYLEEELRDAGYTVVAAAGGEEALQRLGTTPVDVVITDLVMPGMRGQQLLGEIRARERGLPVVVITAFGSIESAVEAVKAGAYHYVAKPFRLEQLLPVVENALRERRLRQEVDRLRRALDGRPAPIVAESPTMKRALDLVERAAAADSPVLLTGETGTGKELLARALHGGGPRRDRPFVAVNCSAIPETLLESQLFGHRRGAFTDAREDRRGLFQEAEGGSILLDEIGDMPLLLQAKLLRVLQEREVHPLGAAAPIKVDVRVIAATHRDLEALVQDDRFRHDLYYRLNVIAVRVPPLRERPEDILPLVAHLLDKHGHRLGRTACSLSPEAVELLRRHPWPGNVRELENAIERALVLGRDDTLWPEDLPETIRGGRPLLRPQDGAPARDGDHDGRPLSEVERAHILHTLRAVGGNKAAAARLLGFDRKTLYRRLEAYGLRHADRRNAPH